MLTFAEEIMLLVLDDETGKLLRIDPNALNFAMAGAVLMDLALRDRIDTDLTRLIVTTPSPTGEPLLDHHLAAIVSSPEVDSAQAWVARLAQTGAEIQQEAIERLVGRGIVRQVEAKILWVFGTRRYPVVDDREEKEVKRRIMDVLLSDDIPTPRDVTLICLADTCNLFPSILSSREAKRLAPRISQVRKLDLIGQAVSRALDQLRLEIAKSVPMHPYG